MTPNPSLAANRSTDLPPLGRAWRASPVRVAALAAVGALLAASPDATAGTTLLSRETTIRAAGDTGVPGDTFDLIETSVGFDRFADRVGTETPSSGLVSLSHQYSVPTVLGESGVGLEGAFAEGQVRSGTRSGGGTTVSQSVLKLLFEVEESNAAFAIGATLGATGAGAVSLELSPAAAGTIDVPIFAVSIDPNEGGTPGMGKSIEEDGLLTPGTYLMSVIADASSLPGQTVDAEAYFTFSFSLSSTGTGGGTGGGAPPVAVPLPPAVLGGGGMLALLALARLRRKI